MRLLIIGGSVFLGRHLVDAALERGHDVTLFNRGRSGPDLFPGVERIQGDRERDLAALDGRRWDAVIDTCGYVPRVVRAAAERLAPVARHYTFVSSISAYADFSQPGLSEDAPAAELSDPGSEDVQSDYGALKAGCERAVQTAFGERALIVRPGLIVGPHDPTERFTYWVRRLAGGGQVLVPDAAEQPVQLIDVRDLAAWMVEAAARGLEGTFNATGPAAPLTFGAMIERIREAAGAALDLAWLAEAELAEAGVEPWSELPLWLDLARHPELRGFLAADVTRALAAGLALRPLEQTVVDTLAWVRERPGVPVKTGGVAMAPAGLSPEREADLLARLSRPRSPSSG